MGGRWRLRCGADASRMSGEGRMVQNIGRGHGLTEIGQFQSPEIPPAPPPLPGSLHYDIGGPTCVARKQFATLSNPEKKSTRMCYPGLAKLLSRRPRMLSKMQWNGVGVWKWPAAMLMAKPTMSLVRCAASVRMARLWAHGGRRLSRRVGGGEGEGLPQPADPVVRDDGVPAGDSHIRAAAVECYSGSKTCFARCRGPRRAQGMGPIEKGGRGAGKQAAAPPPSWLLGLTKKHWGGVRPEVSNGLIWGGGLHHSEGGCLWRCKGQHS